MATKNIVPRANGEGGIGTSAKRWLSGFFKNINVDTEAIVPTPANNDNSTKAATTAWVENVFFTKLVAKLLATTAATITSLSTSSLFYRFLAQALSVAGVQYNLSNSSAWYICLGSLFGGLIIQGGYTTTNATDHIITFPLSVSSWRVPVILPFALSQVAYIHDPDNIGAHDGFHARLSVATLCYWIAAGK